VSNHLPGRSYEQRNSREHHDDHGALGKVLKDSSVAIRTLKFLMPAIIIIAASEMIVRLLSGGYNVTVILLLGAVMYTSMRFGLRHGLITAFVIVIYNFYLISELAGVYWLGSYNLQRGAVIAIAFPVIATIVGRLKDYNDSLLASERTARREAEESERQLRFMAESMPQKIFTMKPNGESEYVNPQWGEYTGLVSEKLADTAWAEIVHPADFIDNQRIWKHSLGTGEPFQFEHRLKNANGNYRWHLTRAHALRNENGSIVTWVGSSTDIEDVRKTRRLEADTNRLIEQRTELMDLNTSKDEFISLASHQLRTPATAVKQYVNMALDGFAGKLSPQVKKLLDKANDSNERQLSIINDLLQVAQVDAGKVILRKEKVDVVQLIVNVIQDQSSKFAKRNQAIVFTEPRKKLYVMADSIKLRMMIENVVDNASKYTPTDKTIAIRVTRARDTARIAIIDEGVGIAKEDADKVFQKFLRLDNPLSASVDGSGLGLYWVRRIVDLHGGSIKVTSKLHKGSTFTISLPIFRNDKLSDSKALLPDTSQ
jgi:PAS domain S-box-containing protein